MWVFDGEEWTQDEGNGEPRRSASESKRPRYEDHVPELQVIEIVPVTPQRRPDVPLPLT